MKTKINTKINNILIIFLLLIITVNSSFADDQLDVKNRVNNMQNATTQIGILGEIFTKIFDTNGKIKEAFLSITNTATNGYVPMWDNLQLINSPIFYLSGKIGIGTTDPSEALEVNGNLHVSGNITLSGGIDGNSIYNSSINTDKIADNTISSADIADNTISSADISDNSITSNDISDNSITSNDISDGTISSNDIADNTITETDINDSFVARDSSLLDGKDSTTTIGTDDTTIPTSKAIKDFIALLGLNDLVDAITENVNSNLFLGYTSGISNTGHGNTGVGIGALFTNTGGTENTAFGSEALFSNTSGSANTALGILSLSSNTIGNENTGLGLGALYFNETGNSNTAIGFFALSESSSGSNNTIIGSEALSNSNHSSNNVIVGAGSMFWCFDGCNNNTSIGFESLNDNDGSGNVALGYQAGYNEAGSNKLYIDNSSTSSPLIYGDFSTNKLTVNGSLKIGVATDTTCDALNEGSIRYDNSGKHFYGCNGTTWLQLDN
ncbi:MAG: hypothetical protein PHS49_00785 [Candidatus Gracilibacteria bacterium]|nr:hypothetical protein [Candidatus Gracilibacteria bacterium]